MRTTLSPCYILHTRPFKETSLLVEAYSQTHGKISLLAKGARRPKGRFRGVLQPFLPLILSWSGAREMDLLTLTGLEVLHTASHMPGKSLFCGLYLNELMMRLLNRGDPSPPLYDLYVTTLNQLCSNGEREIEPTLRAFELGLLQCLGYAIDIYQDAKTGLPIEADGVYGYDPHLGVFALDSLPADPYPILVTVAGASILAMQEGVYKNKVELQDAKRLLRAALGGHLGNKPLKSREIVHQLFKQKV